MTAHSTDDSSSFLSRARLAPRFDVNEEHELALRWSKQRDRRAAEQLAHAQFRNVVAIALTYRRYGLPLGDLVAEGNFGVVRALDKYDPSRGVRFATYANHWVRSTILAHVVRSWSVVGGGSGALRTRVFFKLRRERARTRAQHGEGPSADRALAEAMGISVEALSMMLQQIDARDTSFELKAVEALADPEEASSKQERAAFLNEVRSTLHSNVRKALTRLDGRELYIAQRCLMAEPEEQMSLAEVGRQLGVCRERARQLRQRTINKLRRHVEANDDGRVGDWLAAGGY